jgi:hypothetical protein
MWISVKGIGEGSREGMDCGKGNGRGSCVVEIDSDFQSWVFFTDERCKRCRVESITVVSRSFVFSCHG